MVYGRVDRLLGDASNRPFPLNDITARSSTLLVTRLEAVGFVDRKRNAADERKVEVFLTAKGKGLRRDSACLSDALLENSKLTIPEMVVFNEQVQRLRKALTK